MAKAPSTWTIFCRKPGCLFRREKIESKNDAKRHKSSHEQWHGADSVVLNEVEALPNTVRVGDRIKIKEECAREIAEACKKADWGVNLGAIRVVTRIDNWAPGGGDRLFVDGPPFAFLRNQVQLAWNSDDERRAGLGIK